MTTAGPLPHPQLVWRNGAPTAAAFDDIYFNPGDGIAEARHVFLEGTELRQRWRAAHHFTIGELGFGTGLNFLAAWELWDQTRTAGGHLHYVSVEGCPLSLEQFSSAHEAFPALASYAARLKSCYPPHARGRHVLHLAPDVTLHLLYGDAAEMLSGLEARMDAWFLDGFAPAKNPDMWDGPLMSQVARCSAPGARLATFTVAGDVRRALQAAGFSVEKAPGFGRKRDMLTATFEGRPEKANDLWAALPVPREPGRIAIVGAGIAGISCAQALARHGCDVTLFEAGPGPGAGATGTPSGLVMPRLSGGIDAPALFYASAHRLAVSAYAASGTFSAGGALHMARWPDQIPRLGKTLATGLFDADRAELLSPEQASQHAGTRVTAPALYFADAGQLDAPTYLARAAQTLNLRTNTDVQRLERRGESWLLRDANNDLLAEADTVIMTCAMGAARLLPMAELPLQAQHGQITRVTGGALALPVAYGGYAAPAGEGLWVGATHIRSDNQTAIAFDPEADQKNLDALGEAMPALAANLRIEDHWFGVRAVTPDMLPLVGPICDADAYRATFAPLAHGRTEGLPPPPYQPGLYVVAGLGSRGFVSGPLLGELLAAQILGTPSPVERNVRQLLHPARFQLRALKRGGNGV